ncbi:family 78 glycoside hydrolase catalytic domain [Plantibacter sp. VKM Ac-2885]|uniref:family 78 glycoside hydrolase catalytic domain n=1 Tax=Plantibacter sp. VKM Ac-2885 TaxID=2783828 RepID=UPI00188D94AC|nr:family 78 glycoside hydrolase catalytic domain [Plantibacter sp. VKM Ac-2885]MBF4512861.1 family 78 glycoside hydrolase catalytic domain [Plantibacter sp. VKM Ac-2885]
MHATPHDLTVDSGGDQFVVTGATPRLSWKPGDGAIGGFELEAVIDGVRQSVVLADGHRYVAWPWSALRSRQRVEWRVRSADAGAEWSESASFEVGLLDEDWRAAWISPVETDDPGYGNRPAHLLGVEFTLEGEVRSARLYATALGLYTAAVNGVRAGRAELSPGSTSYDRTLYAQAFDVAAALVTGSNRLDVDLSDGWYRGQVGAFRIPSGWGSVLGLRAELHVDFADGGTLVVRSDDRWESRPSTITRADLMDGQTVDLTVADVEAADETVSSVLIDAVVDPPAIDWSPAPAVTVVASRAPSSVRELREGVWVVDFGQNASGWLRLGDLGPAGTRTEIDYGEYVEADGDLSTTHLDSHRPGEPVRVFRQHDEVVAGETPAVFEPRHTVHGFQYARIVRHGAPLDPATISMQIVHTDLAQAGTFSCSDPDLNELHRLAEWSFLGNAVDVPTDCPTRERLAWSGDYQVFVSTATRLRDVSGFSRKWLRSVRDDQLDDGRITNFSPDGRRIKQRLDDQFAMMTGSAGWGDAIVAVPWELYRSYGDTAVLAENWGAMVRWVDWALDRARETRHHARQQRSPEPEAFEEFLWDGTFHWGEWTEPRELDADGNGIDPIVNDPMAWFMADKGEVGTAYLFRSASTLAQIAAILGQDEAAGRYALVAEQVRSAWQTAYLRPDGTTETDTQAAYVRALSFGLLPEDRRAAALDRLVELIRLAGTHLGTGFLSTGDLLPVLVEGGRADVAYELLTQRSEPSWLTMVDRGATTIWEAWEGIDADGVAHESLNHYSKGTFARFLHEYTLGLRQAEDSIAWDSIVIAPVPGAGLSRAQGSHESPNGTITVRWGLEGGELLIDAEIPAETTARIVFPDGTEFRSGPGRFSARRPHRTSEAEASVATI